jgi:hypothetical protein
MTGAPAACRASCSSRVAFECSCSYRRQPISVGLPSKLSMIACSLAMNRLPKDRVARRYRAVDSGSGARCVKDHDRGGSHG